MSFSSYLLYLVISYDIGLGYIGTKPRNTDTTFIAWENQSHKISLIMSMNGLIKRNCESCHSFLWDNILCA